MIDWNKSPDEIDVDYKASIVKVTKGEVVKCINNGVIGCTKGKEYPVVKTSSMTISIIDDFNKQHSYMLELDFFSDIYIK